jgi:hypothetical protein
MASIKDKKTPTPKQEKLIKIIRENLGNRNSTKTLGEMVLEAGYTKATSKNAYLIFEGQAVREATDEIADAFADKRKMALTHITKKKLARAPARELAYVADIFTKNIQLLSGKPTERTDFNLETQEKVKNAIKGIL